PFVLTVVMCIASGAIMLFIPEEIPIDGISKEAYSTHILNAIGLVKNNRVLVLLFAFSLIFAIMGTIELVFRQLYLQEELNISVFIKVWQENPQIACVCGMNCHGSGR
ncbi:MAG: hypothetical protein ACFFGZ_13100, partial [Candidatus Thorarchaeota archaeon]